MKYFEFKHSVDEAEMNGMVSKMSLKNAELQYFNIHIICTVILKYSNSTRRSFSLVWGSDRMIFPTTLDTHTFNKHMIYYGI